jgi:adenylate cyclase
MSIANTCGTVQALISWLSEGDCRDLGEAALTSALGERLRALQVPLDRLTLHIRMPHPELTGLTVAWAPDEPVEVHERAHSFLETADFLGSPLRVVMETRETMHVRLDTEEGKTWTHIDVFQDRGLTELFIVSLSNSEGPSAATFCTTDPRGFSQIHCDILIGIVPALHAAFEIRVLRRVKRMLMDTYVGSNTARRILAGQIRRGNVETMEVVLMLCDLRGFTELSNRLPNARILEILDLYFDRVVPSITEAGGEVLKFMGDSVLAYFAGSPATHPAAAAINAAMNVMKSLSTTTLPDATLAAGIALHHGKVSYGNIGAAGRLDFTVVGKDVNLLHRIQGMCAVVDRPILLSQGFASLLRTGATKSVGRHRLKGFSEPVELHALQDSTLATFSTN